ncbi:MAG: hypothetical protein M3Q27_10795 [Actinomycetota bacterium]|nr:hypothetical protein [Actinomycetota bacterium]
MAGTASLGVRRTLARRSGTPWWRRPLPGGWPLVALYAGFPLWWLAGFSVLGFFLACVPMALYLLRRRTVLVPRGFGVWLLFLVWVLAGVATLWATPPDAMPVSGASRLLPYGYRVLWYLTATVFLLYVGNTDERELPTRRVYDVLGWMFLVTVAGGYLGALVPGFDMASPLELALPAALARNDFLVSLIHPASAQVQAFLGFEAARPKAPYLYANEWGANYGLLLPFFLLSWGGRAAAPWRRRAMPFLLLLAVPPAILSLNRGLWLGVIAAAAYVAVRLALQGRLVAIAGVLATAALVAGVLVLSPLGTLLQERLATPHSNQGRGQLATMTVENTVASPIVGYGTSRQVRGNFFSIAGGATAECPRCSPPQMGTQGHLWFLLLAHGFVGAALFIGFFGLRYARALRDGSLEAILLTSTGVYLAVVIWVYDLLAAPIAVLAVTLALLWRRERALALTAAPVPAPRGDGSG